MFERTREMFVKLCAWFQPENAKMFGRSQNCHCLFLNIPRRRHTTQSDLVFFNLSRASCIFGCVDIKYVEQMSKLTCGFSQGQSNSRPHCHDHLKGLQGDCRYTLTALRTLKRGVCTETGNVVDFLFADWYDPLRSETPVQCIYLFVQLTRCQWAKNARSPRKVEENKVTLCGVLSSWNVQK